MQNNKTKLLDEVATYYAEKLAEHGDTPRGVDWNGEESQTIRFEQLCKVIDPKKMPGFSLNDLGCIAGLSARQVCSLYIPRGGCFPRNDQSCQAATHCRQSSSLYHLN